MNIADSARNQNRTPVAGGLQAAEVRTESIRLTVFTSMGRARTSVGILVKHLSEKVTATGGLGCGPRGGVLLLGEVVCIARDKKPKKDNRHGGAVLEDSATASSGLLTPRSPSYSLSKFPRKLESSQLPFGIDMSVDMGLS